MPSRELIERARELRRTGTPAERLLWELLRDRQLHGHKFRRQHPLGHFIADFFCDEARLIIELDGAVHAEASQQERDRARDEVLRQFGLRVLRFTNEQVLQQTEQVLATIGAHLLPSPAAPGEGPGVRAFLPLYEAKLMHQFDHRFATYTPDGDTRDLTPDEKADPTLTPTPRYWVDAREVNARLGDWQRGWLLGFRDIARSTDERTAIFSLLPRVGVGHTAPLMFLGSAPSMRHVACFLANANTFVLDYIARQKIGGTHLTYGYLKQFPVLPPSAYSDADIAFIAPRVLELVYTAWDMQPFARDMGYDGPPFIWDEDRRAVLRAELDAYYAHLYGLTRDELRYILDPADVFGPDFPGETFRVLKEKEIRQYGEYRTRRLVLEAWERLGF